MRMEPEASHDFAMASLQLASQLQLDRLAGPPVLDPVEHMGLRFPNRIGLAAGLDKNADAFEMLGGLGFGFVEVGTVTPRPQPGNPKPRLFRIPEARALINRLGFNNLGLDHLLRRVANRRYGGVLGINIGKNKDTPPERSLEDYNAGLTAVHAWADYVTLNLSSPNTPGLRDLQLGQALDDLLTGIADTRACLADREGTRTPLLVKLAPDLHDDDIKATTDRLIATGIDGVIATNTTIARPDVSHLPVSSESGGLSGPPLHARSLEVLRCIRATAGTALTLIGVGGIDSGRRARAARDAGADLVQIYTGFIYHGPALVREIARDLRGSHGGG
ncbi:MAG: dihydroorotate dehydrogenase (quinone) [Gammaproteobacteria bacterium]|nr:MAG: dihydroorotate dehydrogenase (quinone) [Gammaproteobacteria bacterium]